MKVSFNFRGGAVQAGNITIIGGGVVIQNWIVVNPEPQALEAREMPVVSDGFASDGGERIACCWCWRSDDFMERENASQSLLRSPPDRLTDVVAALTMETDAEAIARLKAVAGHLFLKPRTPLKAGAGFLGVGALGTATSVLGVKYDSPAPVHLPGQEAPVMGVKVAEINPGFPSLQDLRVGDIIVAIAGKPLPIDQTSDDEGDPAFMGGRNFTTALSRFARQRDGVHHPPRRQGPRFARADGRRFAP